MKRKIAAILAADVVGYSRLVAEDEEGAIGRLVSCRTTFSSNAEQAGGRIFNTAGDAILVEFASAVDAIRAAISIQEGIRNRNKDFPAGSRMQFRIGMTVGDVVQQEGDLLGDAVNIASRLEGLAPAGGVCISQTAHDQIANKVLIRFTDIGTQRLKNIPVGVHAYTLSFDDGNIAPAPKVRNSKSVGFIAAPLIVFGLCGTAALVFSQQNLDHAFVSWLAEKASAEAAPENPAVEPVKQTPSDLPTAASPSSPAPSNVPPVNTPQRQRANLELMCRPYDVRQLTRVTSTAIDELERYRIGLAGRKMLFSLNLAPSDAATSLGFGLQFSSYYGMLVEQFRAASQQKGHLGLRELNIVLVNIEQEERRLLSEAANDMYLPSLVYLWMLQQGSCSFPSDPGTFTAMQMVDAMEEGNLSTVFSDDGRKEFAKTYGRLVDFARDTKQRDRFVTVYQLIQFWRDNLLADIRFQPGREANRSSN